MTIGCAADGQKIYSFAQSFDSNTGIDEVIS
jgi:hypothetical protein